MRKYCCILSLFTCLWTVAQNASNIELLTERANSYDTYKYMSGMGGVRIVSTHHDLIPEVKSGNGDGHVVLPHKILNDLYEYIIPVNIKSSPEVLIGVTLKGKIYPGTILEKQLKPNYLKGWRVELPEIIYNEEKAGGEGLWPNPDEALIEVRSILDLNIKIPQSFRKDFPMTDNADKSKKIYKIHVPVTPLVSRQNSILTLDMRIEKLENDTEKDPIILQRTIDSLNAEKARLELEIEELTKLYIKSGVSNTLCIDINGIRAKEVKKYGVEELLVSGKTPIPYDPSLKFYVGGGINPMLQMAPTVCAGIDWHRLNVWISYAHGFGSSEKLYVYNAQNDLLGTQKYYYKRLALNVGREWELREHIAPMVGIMPHVGITWDNVTSYQKGISGNGFWANNLVAGVRVSLKTRNRRADFFISPEYNMNIVKSSGNNYEEITGRIKSLKRNFDILIGCVVYWK